MYEQGPGTGGLAFQSELTHPSRTLCQRESLRATVPNLGHSENRRWSHPREEPMRTCVCLQCFSYGRQGEWDWGTFLSDLG